MPDIYMINGKFVTEANAVISLHDRGLLFGDAIYEVIVAYKGRPFALKEHLRRLRYSAGQLDYKLPFTDEELESFLTEACQMSAYQNAKMYLQVSRGQEPRSHVWSDSLSCQWFLTITKAEFPSQEEIDNGVAMMTTPDIRWKRVDIKTVNLLPNSLASFQARKQGFYDAIFYNEKDIITEGSSFNVFIVKDNAIYTYPVSQHILQGISRIILKDIAQQEKIAFKEEPFSKTQLYQANEAFISGTTVEALSVISVDDQLIGDGKPGPIGQRLFQKFQTLK